MPCCELWDPTYIIDPYLKRYIDMGTWMPTKISETWFCFFVFGGMIWGWCHEKHTPSF